MRNNKIFTFFTVIYLLADWVDFVAFVRKNT